jgi:Mg/Co/Ni transporter MgtE
MSARAAWRLESLGFSQIFRYVPGKADWFASGLPRAGKLASASRAGDLARRDVPTCRLTDRLGHVQQRIRAAGGDVCVVVNDARVVLGLLREAALKADPQTVVEQLMESGPKTYRPNVALESVMTYLRKNDRDAVLVTTSDGQLIGLLYRKDVEREQAHEQPATSGEAARAHGGERS